MSLYLLYFMTMCNDKLRLLVKHLQPLSLRRTRRTYYKVLSNAILEDQRLKFIVLIVSSWVLLAHYKLTQQIMTEGIMIVAWVITYISNYPIYFDVGLRVTNSPTSSHDVPIKPKTHNPNSLNLYPHIMIIPTVFMSPPSTTDQMTRPEFL